MLAFTTDDFLTIFREEVADRLEGESATNPDSECLWKNVEAYRYMTAAADAVARDVEGIYKILSIPLVVDQQAYSLPRNILHIREARLVNQRSILHPSNADIAVRLRGDDYGERINGQFWNTKGRPRYYIRDYSKTGILLTPIPSSVDTLELQCTATLAVPLCAGLPMPFMDVPDQELMLLYMQYRAYRKQDADTLDLKRSDGLKAQYDETVIFRKETLESYRRTPGLIEQWDGNHGSSF